MPHTRAAREDDVSVPDEAVTAALLDGRYQLGECVGQGGMARVFRAEDVLLGRTVAIKMMRTDADELAIPPRARTEMALLASLNHPSLVTLYDASIVPGRPEYLVMEFVEGRSLAHALHESPLDAAEVAGIAGELASALHVVHAAGIVHRDVKPSNVLLAPTAVPGRRFWAKLADFGVAYLADSTRLTSPGMVMGTAAYLAPEQVRGEAAGAPADVYALGLLLLEALTGQRAFPEASGIGQVMARLVETPSIPDWVGPEWSALLSAMIAREPFARPTALKVAHAARALPIDLMRPTGASATTTTARTASATVAAPPDDRAARAAARDETTQAVEAVAPVAPLATTRPRTRRRRSRAWWVAGAAAAAAAALVLAGQLWAGGLSGGNTADPSLPAVTDPTPSIAVDEVADDDAPVDQTLVDDDAPADDSDTSDRVDEKAAKAEKDAEQAAEKAEKEAQKAAENAAKEAEKAAKDAADAPANNVSKRSEQAAKNANENSTKKGPGKKDAGG